MPQTRHVTNENLFDEKIGKLIRTEFMNRIHQEKMEEIKLKIDGNEYICAAASFSKILNS